MKKMLCSVATGVAMLSVGASSLMAGNSPAPKNALAQTPSLTISGETTGTYYVFRGSQREAKGGRGGGHLLRAENSRINFDIFGKAEGWGGLEYSYLIGLSGNTQKGNNPVEENRIKLKGRWGTFFIGTHRGADHIMPVGAYLTAGGSGGALGGNYKEVVAISTGVNCSVDMVGTVKDTNRVTYVTPRVYGLQFGVSMAPLGHNKGESDPNSYKNPDTEGVPFERNVVSLGLNFKHQLNQDWNFKVSGVGVFAKVEPGTRAVHFLNHGNNRVNLNSYKRVASYAVGANMAYKNFDIGVEFIDNGRSLVYSNVPGANAGQVSSIGMGYAWGNDRFTLGWLFSSKRVGDFKNNGYNPTSRANVVHLSWDRTLAPGLNVFAEAVHFDFKTPQSALEFQRAAKAQKSTLDEAVGNNHGHVIMSGVKVRF